MQNRKKSGLWPVLAAVGIVAVLALLLPEWNAGAAFRAVLKIVLIAGAGLLLLVGVVLFFALYRPKNASASGAAERKKTELSEENAALLARGRTNLTQLRSMSVRIRNAELRGKCAAICKTAEKILQALRDDPSDIPTVRKFFNYYLPTLGSIITKYEYLERSGAPLDEMTQKVSGYLDQIQSAMDRQYANLFEDDLLDMTAEMQTMTAVCRQDGLLTDDGTELRPDAERPIRLTL